MATRVFLGLSAFLWISYGVYCWIEPGALAATAGVASQSATGSTELRAMYGGVQAALGVLAALALRRPALVGPALVTLGTVTAGLFTARLLGTFVDGGLSAYTGMALLLEITLASGAFALLRRTPASV